MIDPNENVNADFEKAKPFFARAEEVASTGNFDYAIDMYLEGLKRTPDALEEGHIPLRHVALTRQGKGGKKPSLFDKVKLGRGKTPLEQMLEAERMLAKDPDNIPYAEAMLKAAVAGGYYRTAEWIAGLVFEANCSLEKPVLATFLLLKDSYKQMEMFDKAVAAAQWTVKLRPEERQLAVDLRDLCAQMTVKKGKYGQEGDFTQSIRDKDKQEQLWAKDSLIKTSQYLQLAVIEARKSLAENAQLPTNIIRLADTLSELETDESDEEAMSLLANAYEKTKDLTFKRHSGELKIRQARRNIGKIRMALLDEPENEKLKQQLDIAVKEFLKTELDYYEWAAKNYPIEMKLRYEYGLRLLQQARYDQALPMFQDARRDLKYKILAMDKIGLCFLLKGWYSDAADIFSQAIKDYEIKDNEIAKNLRYNLARVYEAQSRREEALDIYRKLCQVDYSYKDARQRVDRLREELNNSDDKSTPQ